MKDSEFTAVRGLTPREWEVACLVAQGKRNREIARLLFISEHTVESHLKHIFRKLGVRSRLEVARLLLRGG